MSPFTPQPAEQLAETQALIPGLPNDVALQILSMIPYSYHDRVKPTCKSWRAFLSARSLIPLRRHLRRASHLLCVFPQDPSISSPYLFDPDNLAWRPIPPMPCNPYVYARCNFSTVALGPCLYVLGGSVFDSRSFPLDRPIASSSAFRFDFADFSWQALSPMSTPRGSFACAAIPSSGQILVAGGGSRHAVFRAAGSRLTSVERYDVGRNEWTVLEGLPGQRAGSVGFVVGRKGEEEEKEFWVMGGYGQARTLSGVFPVDDYYKDAVVMDVKGNGMSGKWREVGEMGPAWGGDGARLGKIVVVEDEDGWSGRPGIFMLDNYEIFRYDMASNFWEKESSVPRKAHYNSIGFVVLDGELVVMMSLLKGGDLTENRRSGQQKKAGTVLVQIYHPGKKTWRWLTTKPPFSCPLDFNIAVMCAIQL
ncbi:hypothetical protein Tsubulata_026270 [Turnera subulata]|uniref:F-box domain-containing protein n=1 Tax=Turnera subulata TaxID=218843 RepID=A0A9Q0FDJ1_9ROSI|nr:hypothetical protein Tsubulata_026270 [Turnera subulata]